MTTRDRILEAADQLFYERGFARTSFADIAGAVKISRGNFYHHFKTKDEILDAVIARRRRTTERMLHEWEQAGDTPVACIRSFIEILIANQAKIMLFGCPVGTLSSELAKLDHRSQGAANALFTLFRDWLRGQFIELGRDADADDLSAHLLARSQGIAILANAFRDEAFVLREVDRLFDWLAAQADDAAEVR